MTFYQFLIANKVDTALFAQNCLLEHQQFEDEGSTHTNVLELLHNSIPVQWLGWAFYWDESLQRNIDWAKLYTKWNAQIDKNPKIQHGFPSFKEL